MPEPTRDRPSRNYEFLFLFSKQPNYYFDRTAIDVPSRAGYRGAIALTLDLFGKRKVRSCSTARTSQTVSGVSIQKLLHTGMSLCGLAR